MQHCIRLAPLWAIVLTLGACSSGEQSPSASSEDQKFAVHEIALEKTPLERKVDGTIEATNQATVSAQTSGRVEELFFDVNDFVPAGTVIMRLRATEQHAGMQQAQAGLQEAITRDAEAKQQFTRIEGLYKEKVATKQEFDNALANRDAASARLEAARAASTVAREGVAYTEVRAPYAGIVTKRLVQVGETVQPGTPLMSGVSLQYLRVNLDLPQSIVEKVRTIKKAAIYVGEKRVEANSLTVFPEADIHTHTFHARANLPADATDLHPGMFVKVGLVVGEVERLLIPVSALVTRSEVVGAYVLDQSGQRHLRQLRVGEQVGDRVEVLAGLNAGDKVVLNPVNALQAAGSQ